MVGKTVIKQVCLNDVTGLLCDWSVALCNSFPDTLCNPVISRETASNVSLRRICFRRTEATSALAAPRWCAFINSNVKRGQNLEAEAEGKNNYEKYQIMINNI